ncbi:hypothetical protein J5N97_019671 [Dioscorea zingiberensis]|uniref:WRKY domain-containing protein n=1 Tax=Dioscorea zingiberensis TaxID=325984 RepID=A0A9D5CFH0_9LILI|nr:hypothetical protein J5N97_019671 [Dioscorea zingiberensis]
MLRQLQAHLDHQPSASPLCKTLAQEILSCIEKAVSLAKPSTSEISEQGPKERERRDLYKRSRKSLPTWTKQVRVSGGQGSEEGSLNDGYQWRKYGEKEILGAKHRRSYFRCTHRHSLRCQATKQVQRTDEDPSILQVTYYGVHTCHEKNHEVMEITGMKKEEEEGEQEEDHDNQQLLNFQTYATSAIKPKDETSSSFSFSFNHTLTGSSSTSTNFAKTSSQLNPELGENISPDAMLEMNFILDPNFPFDDTPKFF